MSDRFNFGRYILMFLFIASLLSISIGYHAIDTSYNILKLSYENNVNYYYDYCDETLANKCISIPAEYKYEWRFVLYGLAIMMAIIIITLSKDEYTYNCRYR